MTCAHRRWHAWLWLLLGPLVWAGFLAGALYRPAPVPAPRTTPARAVTIR
jgi:hypothetical protein